MLALLLFVPFIIAQSTVPQPPCVGWGYDSCMSSCFCVWCPDVVTNETDSDIIDGVCKTWYNRDKCTDYTSIHNDKECEMIVNQMSTVYIVMLSVMFSILTLILVGSAIFVGIYFTDCGREVRRKWSPTEFV